MTSRAQKISLILSEVEGRGGLHRTVRDKRPRPSTSLRMRAFEAPLSFTETPRY